LDLSPVELLPDVFVANNRFGEGVAISGDGDYIAVGEPGPFPGQGGGPGAVHVFARSAGNTWDLQQKVVPDPPDDDDTDSFGTSVSLNAAGTVLVVGAPLDAEDGGKAGAGFVFTRSGSAWTQQQKILPDPGDAAPEDRLGQSVSLNDAGNILAIGAPHPLGPPVPPAAPGQLYVFTETGGVWTQQQKVVPDPGDGEDRDFFGYSVSLNAAGDILAAGAPLDNTAAGSQAGSTYVFTRSGSAWTQQQKITDIGSGRDRFGFSVSLNSAGDVLAAGAYLDDTAEGVDAGSVYVFTESGGVWTLQQKITDIGAPGDRFGDYVSLDSPGTTLAIGSNLDDTGAGVNSGSAYIFVEDGGVWTQQQQLFATDPVAGSEFGWSLACLTGTVVIGSPKHSHAGGVNAGSAYVFARSGDVWVIE
jgi:hypothetical protein